MLDLLHDAFLRLIDVSWHGSIVIAIVLAVQLMLGRWLTPNWRCALWAIAFARLMLPVLPANPLAVPITHTERVAPLSAGNETITYGVITSAATEKLSMPSAMSAHHRSLMSLAPLIWLTVAIGMIAIRVFATACFALRLRRLPRLADRRICCVETDLVRTPALTGVFKSRLLLPRGFAVRISAEQLEFVIQHELAHARRRDVLVGWITWLIGTIHWFNPIVWFAYARFRVERELACDAAVLASRSADDRARYGNTILRMLELYPATPMNFGAVGMVGGRWNVRRRIAAIQSPARRWSIIGPIVLLAIGCATLTGPRNAAHAPQTAARALIANAPDPADSNPVTRVYDCRDLLIDVPNFTNAPELNVEVPSHHTSNAAAATTQPLRSREQMLDDLQQTIMDEIAPLSWKTRGGAMGDIKYLGGQLIITQTPANHDAIQSLLADMRGAHGVQVLIETRFLSGDAAFDALQQIDPANRWQPAKGFQVWPAYLSEKQTQALIRAAQSSQETTLITAPRLTMFDGQRCYVVVSRQTAFVADLKPSATQPGKYDPEVGIAHSGVLLDVQANVSIDRKNVTLTLRPQLSTIQDLTTQPWRGESAAAGVDAPTIQVPHMVFTKFEMTSAVPDGQTAILRVRPRRDPAIATLPAPAPVLVMVRPTIVVQRESADKAFPLLSSPRAASAAAEPAR